MGLAELTDPDAVLHAIAEYDELGETKFLDKYGRGPARGYLLEYGGRFYPSKAIAVAAHDHQTGTRSTGNPFSGGKNHAAARLERLGFTVHGPGSPTVRQSFAVMWNPDRFEWEPGDLAATRSHIAENGASPGNWSTGQTTQGIEPGDRIYLLLVGNHGRGLIGSGYATSTIYQGEGFNPDEERAQNYVDIEWDALLEQEDLLPRDEILAAVPGYPATILGNGRRFDPVVASELNSLWQEHLGRVLSPGAGDLDSPGIETGYRTVLARQRLNQDKFRALLLEHQERACVVCGITRIELLEAAHIIPYSQGGASSLANGRLMCANHHKAHDAGLLQLDIDGNVAWADWMEPI